MTANDAAETALWIRYRSANDHGARDALFLQYMPWATAIARSVHRRVRVYPADRDDFVQNATIGLLEAMSRYDPARGVAFRHYAQPRIRGAVFNGLRAIVGERPSATDNARFAARLGSLRQTADTEGSGFDAVVDAIVGLGIGYLLDEVGQSGHSRGSDAFSHAEVSETEARLQAAVSALPDRLKLIVQSHYFQYLPFKDLALQLGLTKGRVSQLHKAALDKLRDAMHTD